MSQDLFRESTKWLFPFLKEGLLPIFLGAMGGWITHFFTRKQYNNDFILKKNYDTHRQFLDKLDDYFSKVEVHYDFNGYVRENKKRKKQVNKLSNVNFEKYQIIIKGDIFHPVNEVRSVNKEINAFEGWRAELRDVSLLSDLKTRRVAQKILGKYQEYKMEETLYLDSISEEVGMDEINTKLGINYISFQKNNYWELFWLEAIKDLLKLRKSLKKFVGLN